MNWNLWEQGYGPPMEGEVMEDNDALERESKKRFIALYGTEDAAKLYGVHAEWLHEREYTKRQAEMAAQKFAKARPVESYSDYTQRQAEMAVQMKAPLKLNLSVDRKDWPNVELRGSMPVAVVHDEVMYVGTRDAYCGDCGVQLDGGVHPWHCATADKIDNGYTNTIESIEERAAQLAKEMQAKEDALLEELLKKRGLVAMPQADAEVVCESPMRLSETRVVRVVTIESVGETSPGNNTPRGLMVEGGLPGWRMGAHAWMCDE